MAGRVAPARSPKVPEIRKGDTVVVLAGKDAGKRGVVDQLIRRDPSPSGSRSVFRRVRVCRHCGQQLEVKA